MKTISTSIKVGQEIKFGNQWGKVVSDPKQSTYVSNEVDIQVITIAGKVRRRSGVTTNDMGGLQTHFSYRKTTMVQFR